MSLPECCVPSRHATRAERLFCAYNNSGPEDRRGLTYDNKEVPSWRILQERARSGDAGSKGVIAKWEAVALVGGMSTERFFSVVRLTGNQTFVRWALSYGATGMSDPGEGMCLMILCNDADEVERWKVAIKRDTKEPFRDQRVEIMHMRPCLLTFWDRLDG